MSNFAEFNTLYEAVWTTLLPFQPWTLIIGGIQLFQGHTPARTCIEVAGLPLGALVEIEVVAATKD